MHNLIGDDIDMIGIQVNLSTEDMIDNVLATQQHNYQQVSQQLDELQQLVLQLRAAPSQSVLQPVEHSRKTLEPKIMWV